MSPYAFLHYRDDRGVEWIEVVVPSRVTAAASYDVVRRFTPEEIAERAQVVGWATKVIAETRKHPKRYLDHAHIAELRALRATPAPHEEHSARDLDEQLHKLCDLHSGGALHLRVFDPMKIDQLPTHLLEADPSQARLCVASLPFDQVRPLLVDKVEHCLGFGPLALSPADATIKRRAVQVLSHFDRFFAHRPLQAAGYLYIQKHGPARDRYPYRTPWGDPLNFDLVLETADGLYVFHFGWSR